MKWTINEGSLTQEVARGPTDGSARLQRTVFYSPTSTLSGPRGGRLQPEAGRLR
jgi:hypothetical protein